MSTRQPRPAAQRLVRFAIALAPLFLSVLVEPAEAASPGAGCARATSSALRSCLKKVSSATRLCYGGTASPCDPSSPKIAAANAVLEAKVLDRCSAPGAIDAAGFEAGLTPGGLVDRLQEACMGELASLAARSFGGPHGKALPGAGAENQECLDEAFDRASRMIQLSFRSTSACAQRALAGKSCDVPKTETKLAGYEASAAERIDKKCTDLVPLIGLGRGEFLARASAQARCLLPIAHGDASPFELDCGPRASVPIPPRATATQVILDESEWGTRCGDGSPYAFWIRPAPEGAPVENVLVYMQGGGVCVFEDDCEDVSSGLFRALDNTLPVGGFLSNTSASNPFRDWTKVFLPYCTQDLHIGGGTTSNFPSITVHRFGALNVRAALRWVRDALWAELDASSPEGFRPDRLRVIFSGGSAGGFGASYNYHYLLDDLRFVHTTAVPDSALGLNNGLIFGIAGLGGIMLSETPPLGWGVRPFMPPYCKTAQCAVVPVLQTAHASRLEAVPDQQILNVSNQVDNTQVSTTFFDSLADWIDALREAYCDTQDLAGVHYFLPAVPSNIHTVLQSGGTFPSLESAGQTIGGWLGDAVDSPETLVDRVEEGDFVTRYGVAPFACPGVSVGAVTPDRDTPEPQSGPLDEPAVSERQEPLPIARGAGWKTLVASGAVWAILGASAIAWLIWSYDDPTQVLARIQQYEGWEAAVLLLAIQIVMSLSLSPIPSDVIGFTMSLMYGFWWGSFLTWSGWMLAAWLQYALVRRIARAVGTPPSLDRLPKWVRNFPVDHPIFLICGRWFPLGPHLVNTAAGACGVPIGRYTLCAAVGIAPTAMVIAALATGLLDLAGQ